MKQEFHSNARASFAVILLMASMTGCVPSIKQRYKDDLVEISERSRINLLNVHSSKDTEVLKIWERTYDDVRGRNPCYLRIPGRPMIIFVTGKDWDNGQATVHLANIDTKEIHSFPAYDSHIGSNIGEPRTDYFEKVLSVDGDTLVIEAGFLDRRSRYTVDLSRHLFIREEGSYDSSISKTREHYVYEAGRKPERH